VCSPTPRRCTTSAIAASISACPAFICRSRAYDARIYTLLTIIIAETAKAEEYQRYASAEGALVFTSGWMGIDLSKYDLDEPIGNVESNAIQSAVAAFRQASDTGKEWTVRDIAAWGGIGGMGPVLVGSGESVADQLLEWAEDTDVDGFNLAYAVTPGTFTDVIEHVVPALEARGAYDRDSLRHGARART
jgi:alkanesulfonate monooxygenase SsuD/methylene tetrahydromethanopterin reductase-like flavin-dependent oxidoreductase (luciferase family)